MGKLHSKIKSDDCMWTLIDNKIVQITLEKFDGMKWWSSVMQGDAEIDGEEKEEDNKEPPPLGNGGSTDKYTWTQTLSALEVFVNVRPGVKAKQIVCDIGVESLKVGIKGDPLILEGKMHSK